MEEQRSLEGIFVVSSVEREGAKAKKGGGKLFLGKEPHLSREVPQVNVVGAKRCLDKSGENVNEETRIGEGRRGKNWGKKGETVRGEKREES